MSPPFQKIVLQYIMMKFYSNNCQKCYEVVKLYDVRLLLLLELGELGGGYMQIIIIIIVYSPISNV